MEEYSNISGRRTPDYRVRDLGVMVGKTIASDLFARLAVDRAPVPPVEDLVTEALAVESEHYHCLLTDQPDPARAREVYRAGVERGVRDYWDAMVRPDLEECGCGRRSDCLRAKKFGPLNCLSSRHTFSGAWKCGLTDREYEQWMTKVHNSSKEGVE